MGTGATRDSFVPMPQKRPIAKGLAVALLALASLLVHPASLLAQRASDDFDARPRPSAEDRRRAVELFESSSMAQRSGDFERAAAQLEEAYALFPQPALLESLARVYDAMGDHARAIEHFELYLEEEPDAPDRGEIEGRLEALREEVRQAQGETEPPPPPAAPGGRDETGQVVGFTLLTLGVLGVGAGGVLTGVAASEHATSTAAATTQAQALAAHQRGVDLGTAGIILLAAGGAVALGGLITLVVVGDNGPPAAPRASVPRASLRLGPSSLSIEGTF